MWPSRNEPRPSGNPTFSLRRSRNTSPPSESTSPITIQTRTVPSNGTSATAAPIRRHQRAGLGDPAHPVVLPRDGHPVGHRQDGEQRQPDAGRRRHSGCRAARSTSRGCGGRSWRASRGRPLDRRRARPAGRRAGCAPRPRPRGRRSGTGRRGGRGRAGRPTTRRRRRTSRCPARSARRRCPPPRPARDAAASSQDSPTPTTPPKPTSQRLGHTSFQSARWWTTIRSSVSTTAMPTLRCRKLPARISARLTMPTTSPSSSTTSTASVPAGERGVLSGWSLTARTASGARCVGSGPWRRRVRRPRLASRPPRR